MYITVFPFIVEMKFYDSAAVREINNNNKHYERCVQYRDMVAHFGPSVLTTASKEHRRHRAVAEPSFTAANSSLVWKAADNLITEIFEAHDAEYPEQSVRLNDAITFTRKVALIVIKVAGFGVTSPWAPTTEEKPRPGRKLTFDESLETIVHGLNTILRAVLPRIAYWLPIKSFKDMDLAFPEFDLIMQDMVAERMSAQSSGEEKADLFGALIRSMNEDSGLTEREVLGNVWTFVFAGHETTANTLAFLMAYLALYPEEQVKLYEHVKEVIGEEKTRPDFGDMNRLTRVLAAVNETIRLQPPAVSIAKDAIEDHVLTLTHVQTGEPIGVPVPKGMQVGANFEDVHYNPRYFPEPYVFRPDRFLESSKEKNHFFGFSTGSYSCIGRRFAEVEAVCIMANLILRYEFELVSKPEETRKQLEKRVLTGTPIVTLQPPTADFILKRRSKA